MTRPLTGGRQVQNRKDGGQSSAVRGLFSAAGFLLLVCATALACGSPGSAEAPPALDAPSTTQQPAAMIENVAETVPPLPDRTLPAMQGDSLRLIDYRGNVLLLNFWATWCAPCREEIPDLNRLHQELSDEGVTVIGVAMDAEGAEAVRPFMEEFDMDYPVVLDDGALADQLGGVYALPTTFVVGPDGDVLKRVMGIFPVEQMRDSLAALAR